MNHKLTSVEFDEHFGSSIDVLLIDPGIYQRLVGILLCLTVTRPDISFVVQNLSQFMHQEKQSHMQATIRVVKYIKHSPSLGIFLSAKASSNLQAFCDADWASCPTTRRSVIGYLVKFGDS